MTDIVLYGISNCDTIKKARRWLQDRDIDYEFHDYRKQGLESDLLDQLIGGLGWEAMLNRRGTTWRALPDTIKDNIDQAGAMQAMLDNPALIKRPILAHSGNLHLGFSESQYEEIFN